MLFLFRFACGVGCEMRSNIIWAGDCIEVRCTCVLMQMGTDCVLTLGTDSVPRLGTDSVPRLGRIAFQNSRISLPVRSKASPKWGRIPSLVSGTKIVPTITKHVLGTKSVPVSRYGFRPQFGDGFVFARLLWRACVHCCWDLSGIGFWVARHTCGQVGSAPPRKLSWE